MKKKIITCAVPIAAVLAIGALGFILIEGCTLLEGIYMTLITLTTIGYGEIFPLSEAGRVFNIVLIILTMGALAYGISSVFTLLLDGRALRKEQKKQKRIQKMKDHYIVCGTGRMIRTVAEELSRENTPFLLLCKEGEEARELEERGYTVLAGSDVKDELLARAGIDRAKGVVVARPTDAETVFTVMTCRMLNSKLYIVAKCEDEKNEEKFIKCGANATVSPSVIGGRRMARMAADPSLNGFLDLSGSMRCLPAAVRQVQVSKENGLAGQCERALDLRGSWGLTLLALIREEAGQINPKPETVFLEKDILVLFGRKEQLNGFLEKFKA